MAEWMIEHGANVSLKNSLNESAISMAARMGQDEFIKKMMEKDPNIVTLDEANPLFKAISSGMSF